MAAAEAHALLQRKKDSFDVVLMAAGDRRYRSLSGPELQASA
jgi:hypothetical protein